MLVGVLKNLDRRIMQGYEIVAIKFHLQSHPCWSGKMSSDVSVIRVIVNPAEVRGNALQACIVDSQLYCRRPPLMLAHLAQLQF